MSLEAAPQPQAARLPLVDGARGLALLAMAVYHFAWDLRFFGFITTDVTSDAGWRVFARLIAGSFLALAGVGLVLSLRRGFDRARYLRRLGVIMAAAAAITIVTWFIFPDGYIFFGILHCIALSSVLALPFIRAPLVVVAAVAVFSLLAPKLLANGAFDAPPLLWLGLATYFPRSNDYVPIFPWFGAVLAGILAARLAPSLWPEGRAAGFLDRMAPSTLVWAGRHSLAIYLLHQPLLLGLVYLAAQIVPPNLIGFEASYLESCRSSCVGSEVEPGLCTRICGCLVERAQAEDIWGGLARNALTSDQTTRYYELADQCRISAEAQ